MTFATPATVDRRAQTRTILLAAGETCFERNGVAATTMEHVADEAGVTRMTLYRHFSSRDELLVLVLLEIWERESTKLAVIIERQPDVASMLVEGASYFVATIASRPFLLDLVRSEGPGGWGTLEGAHLLSDTFGDYLRPYVAAHRREFRATIDDTIEWLMRQVLLLLTVSPRRGLTPKEVRRQARTFIVPSVVR